MADGDLLGPVRIETNLTPPILLNGGNGDGAAAGGWLTWLQPTIRGHLPVLGPFTVAPYGPAIPGIGALIFYGVLGLATYGAWRLLTRKR